MPQPSRILAPLAAALFLAACQDPCVLLAQRICQCEPSPAEQRLCIERRIEAQEEREPSDEELLACEAALETCSCQALDENRYDLCGFSREGGAAKEGDGSS